MKIFKKLLTIGSEAFEAVRVKLYAEDSSGNDVKVLTDSGFFGSTQYDDDEAVAPPARVTAVAGYDNADGKVKSLLVGAGGGLYLGFMRNSSTYNPLSGQVIGSFPYTSSIFTTIDSIGFSKYGKIMYGVRAGSNGSGNTFTVDIQGAVVNNVSHFNTIHEVNDGVPFAQGSPYQVGIFKPLPFIRFVVKHIAGTLGGTQDITVYLQGVAL